MLTEQNASPSVDVAALVSVESGVAAVLTADETRSIQQEMHRAELALYTLEKTLSVAQVHVDEAHYKLLADAWEHLRDPMIALGLECRCTVDHDD